MAVPATTGQLKTKVSDMEIRDYIICEIDWSKPFDTWMYNLGKSTAIEIPPGAPIGTVGTPNIGSYYFVKTAKGLLVADRVIKNNWTWDAINTVKLIQGLPWDNGNIIPTMTSNTSPSGVASASNEWSLSPAYKAFDKQIVWGSNPYYGWGTSQTIGWLQYKFSAPTNIRGYALRYTTSEITNRPNTWTFEGSMDGITWTVLDKRSNITWVTNETKKYSFSNTVSYEYYRINVSANNGATSFSVNLAIEELEMYETAGIIRSLTGGVAYADANGNKSMTQPTPSNGGWPQNNEYDKFIKAFPVDKIQAGKTLDDVFHHQAIYTWCQDTTINGTFIPNIGSSTNSANISRTARGNENASDWKDIRTYTSAQSSTLLGFRPCFEFKE